MQRNKEISHSTISSIAISTIFIASFMLSGSQFSQVLAIHEGNATAATQSQLTGGNNTTTTGLTTQPPAGIAGNTTANGTPPTTSTPTDTTNQSQAVPGGNATETGAASAPTPTAAVQEPPVNQNFVRQGTVASSTELPIAGPEGQNFAFILPPRSDGGVYSGVLTYTASKPVGVAVLHNYDPQNSTAIPEEYGTELTSPLPDGAGNIAITLFQPPYDSGVNAASVPFTGNALALHTTEEGPFTATFTVNAFATQPESANAPLEFVAEGVVGEEAGDDTAADEDTGEADEEDTGEADEEDTGEADEEDTGEADEG